MREILFLFWCEGSDQCRRSGDHCGSSSWKENTIRERGKSTIGKTHRDDAIFIEIIVFLKRIENGVDLLIVIVIPADIGHLREQHESVEFTTVDRILKTLGTPK